MPHVAAASGFSHRASYTPSGASLSFFANSGRSNEQAMHATESGLSSQILDACPQRVTSNHLKTHTQLYSQLRICTLLNNPMHSDQLIPPDRTNSGAIHNQMPSRTIEAKRIEMGQTICSLRRDLWKSLDSLAPWTVGCSWQIILQLSIALFQPLSQREEPQNNQGSVDPHFCVAGLHCLVRV